MLEMTFIQRFLFLTRIIFTLFAGTIFLSAVSAGLETEDDAEGVVMHLNTFIRLVFTVDVCCRLLAEPYSWKYFDNNWNRFDVLIVLVSWIPVAAVGGKYLVALKMLRLLRLLKIVKRFKTLKIILSALSSSARSIIIICGLMFFIMTLIAVIGHFLFKDNDPAHFGNIRVGFLTMFQVLTLDSWSLLMYINMYGCNIVGYDDWPERCSRPKSMYVVAALFFTASVAILTWVMVTMFIGLLTTGMEESLLKRRKLEEVEMKVRRVLRRWKKLHCSRSTVFSRNLRQIDIKMLKKTFDFLDFSKRGAVGRVEIFFALEISGLTITSDEFDTFWRETTKQNSNMLDFSEFLTIILNIRDLALKSRIKREESGVCRSIPNVWGSSNSCESYVDVGEHEPDIVSVWEFKGEKYLRSRSSNVIYAFHCPHESDERLEIGIWDENSDSIIFHEKETKRNLSLQNFGVNSLLFGQMNDGYNFSYQFKTGNEEQNVYTHSGRVLRNEEFTTVKTLASSSTDFACIFPEFSSKSKNSEIECIYNEDPEDIADVVKRIEFQGTTYLRSKLTGKIYPEHCPNGTDERHVIGHWNNLTESIELYDHKNELNTWSAFQLW